MIAEHIRGVINVYYSIPSPYLSHLGFITISFCAWFISSTQSRQAQEGFNSSFLSSFPLSQLHPSPLLNLHLYLPTSMPLLLPPSLLALLSLSHLLHHFLSPHLLTPSWVCRLPCPSRAREEVCRAREGLSCTRRSEVHEICRTLCQLKCTEG